MDEKEVIDTDSARRVGSQGEEGAGRAGIGELDQFRWLRRGKWDGAVSGMWAGLTTDRDGSHHNPGG